MKQDIRTFADDYIRTVLTIGYVKGIQDTISLIITEYRLDDTKDRLVDSAQSVDEDKTYHNFSTDSSGDIMKTMQRVFIEKLTEIPEIEYIYSAQDNDIIRVWSIINRHSKAIKKRIYDREYDILDKFSVISFDFQVLVREDRPVNEMAPTGADLVFQRN